jgi:hypothetical protein
MKPTGPLKLVGQLIDLPLIDKDGRWCGIVDDIELEGEPGEQMHLKALLVGPRAYRGRMPPALFWFARKLAGDHLSRVPIGKVATISSAVHLSCSAEQVGLHRVEDKVRSWIPRWGAL